MDQIARADSFGWTALATLLEGAFMAGFIAVLAAGLLALGRFWPWLGRRLGFPAGIRETTAVLSAQVDRSLRSG